MKKGENNLINALFGESGDTAAKEITVPEDSDALTPEVKQWLDGFSSYTDQMIDCLIKVKKGEQYMSEAQLKTLTDQYGEYCKTFDALGTELWKKGTDSADYLYYQDTASHIKAKEAEWQTFIAQYDTPQTQAPKKDTPKNDELSPEFKKLMDGYEQFIDEYIAFMQSIDSDNAPITALLRLASYTAKYAQTMEELAAIEDEELSAADAAYYVEVWARISQKLLKIAS